jgi:hypothetical protein
MSVIGKLGTIGALCLASLPLSPQAMGQTHPTTIALSPYLGVLWSFEGEFAGKRHIFLFDTGGGVTAITPASAAEAGCTPWGQISGLRMRGDRIDMPRCNDVTIAANGVALTAATAGVLDFSKLLPKDAPPLAGSVGLNSFVGRIVTIDLAHRQIILETPQSLEQRIAGAKEVEIHLAGEVAGHAVTPFLAIGTPRGKVWMEMDTGNNSTVIVASHNAELFAMKPDSKDAQRFEGTLVGNVPLKAEDAHTMPLALDGNIGIGTLQHWIITMDMGHGRAWIAPANP